MLLDDTSDNEEENVDNEQSDSDGDDTVDDDSDTSDDVDDDTAPGGDEAGDDEDGDEEEDQGKKIEKKPAGSQRLAQRFRDLTGSLKAKDEENNNLRQQLEKVQADMEILKRGGNVEDRGDDDEIDLAELSDDPKELARVQQFLKLQKKAKKFTKDKDATPAQIKALMDEIKTLKKSSEDFQKQSAQQADQDALRKEIGKYADVIDADTLEARVYDAIYEWEHSKDPRERVLAQAPWAKIVKLVLDDEELDDAEAAKIKAKKKKTAKKIDTEKGGDDKVTPSGEKTSRWNPGDPLGSREALMERARARARAASANQ